MSIEIGSGMIRVAQDWAAFKATAVMKKILVQYEENPKEYEIFGVDGSIVYTTVIYTGSVPVGSAVDQATNDANKADFEANFKPVANQPIDVASRLVTVNVHAEITTSPFYGLVVDLDGGNDNGGPYKHVGGSSIKTVAILGSATKEVITDSWVTKGGVVLSINETQSVIAWLQPGTADLRVTDVMSQRVDTNIAPEYLDLLVEGGALSCLADNDVEVVTALTTLTPLPDIGGTPRVLAPGDLLFSAFRSDGSGSLTSNFMIWYYVG